MAASSNIFLQIDLATVAISAIFWSSYIGIYIGLFVHVGNLETIRRRFIYNSFANAKENIEIIDFIDSLRKRSKVLVSSTRRRYWPYRISVWAFGFFSVFAAIYKPLSDIFYLPARDLVLYAYIFSLAVAIVFLISETRFFIACHELENCFFQDVPQSEKIILVKRPAGKSALEEVVTKKKKSKQQHDRNSVKDEVVAKSALIK